MTERIVKEGIQPLYLLLISGFLSVALGSSDFHLINIFKNYTEAKSYCREMFSDLATVRNSTEMEDLIALVSSSNPRTWIGLETGDEWMWHWSWPNQQLDYSNWKATEPQTSNQDTCAAMDQRGEWIESDCGTKRSFVCGGLIFVAETKSWRDAQDHCRGLSSDLISIHSAEENEAVNNVSVAQNVWIGLFRDRWRWSDGSETSYRYWKPNQPNYLKDQDCTVAVFKDGGKWNDLRCSANRKFICRGEQKPNPASSNQTSTETPANLTTPPYTSSPEVTVTHHPNTSNPSHSTNGTTPEPTTPNNTSNSELSHATTATQLPPTEGFSTPTSTHNATPSSTLTPSDNTFPTGKLILIQENLTWIEALDYCRQHHEDLVHIAAQHVQETVAEMANNASSPHIWLGLRYTCKFNFWFWTKSTTGCYQNWAPGQRPEHECGVTGAIQATGGQQWVALPETEKLNFICSGCSGPD